MVLSIKNVIFRPLLKNNAMDKTIRIAPSEDVNITIFADEKVFPETSKVVR
jgi:hypothetical protein